MIKVKFVVNYRGVLTAEKFYKRGAAETFSNTVANALIDAGRAVEVEAPKPKPRAKKAAAK